MDLESEKYKLKWYSYFALIAFGIPTLLLFFIYPYLYQIFYTFLFCFVVYLVLMITVGRMKRRPSTPSDKIKYFGQLYNRPDKKAKGAGAFSMGLSCLEQDKYDKALMYFKESLGLHPDEAYVKWDYIGQANFLKGEYDEALESFSKAKEINSSYTDAWSHQVIVYKKVKDYKKALNICKDAIELFPKNEILWRDLIGVYMDINEFEDAVQFCKKIIDSDPNNEVALAHAGGFYFQIKDVEKGLIAVKSSLRINPRYTDALGLLGKIYAYTGKIEKALEAYDNALEIDSEFEKVKKLREELLKSSNISA